MNVREAKQVIVEECIRPSGFAILIRENRVDQAAFSRLLQAIQAFSPAAKYETIDRLVVACLFDLPWEVENTIEHYSKQSRELGLAVSKMAETLREAIMELLWAGLESDYQE